jgi:hypothetical protein
LGANRFEVPDVTWEKMTDAERWIANRQFLDETIARGDKFVLSDQVTNINDISGYFRMELDYLLANGYRLSDDGLSLIKVE